MATTKIIKSDLIFPHVSSRTRTQTSVTLLSQADPLLIYHHVIHHHFNFFSTDLPLAETRWVRSTFSSQCHISSNQCRWLTSAASINFPLKNSGTLGIECVAGGSRSKYANHCSKLTHPSFWFSVCSDGVQKSLLTRALSARIFSRGTRLSSQILGC